MSSSLSLLQSSPQTVAESLQKYCGDDVVPYKGGGVKLTDVNPHLVCVLCHGYFVDATSIVECLHSFCRSCIVLHLDKHSFCPICREEIQNSKALKPDKALQDIVYKLVPGLFHSEMKRRQEFYQKHPHRDMHLHPEARGVSVDRLIYTADELISLSLEYFDKECEQEMWKNVTDDKGLHYIIRAEKPPKCVVRKRYLECPAAVRMSHLKKFVRLKYNLKSSDFIELLYRRESLPEEYTIMDIAYIYTWNRNEPMRFFYKINARVTVPVMPTIDKQLVAPTDVMTTQLRKSPITLNTMETTTPLPPKIKLTDPPSPVVGVMEKQEITGTKKLLKLSSVTDRSTSVDKAQQRSITESNLIEPVTRTDITKKDRQPSPLSSVAVPMVPLNPPISPEGTSKKENVSDNVRNSCANDSEKTSPTMLTKTETKKLIDPAEPRPASTAINVTIKKLEKLVDQQQKAPMKTVTTSINNATSNTTMGISSSPSYLPKKINGIGESKLNLSISKLYMKNQNAAAAAAAAAAATVTTTKFVPTLQQMQQIGMHTSIPTIQQQSSSLQSKVHVRPGYSGPVSSFKRTQDILPARSQAPTNRPPFIPVRKSYEWNKARTLAAKPAHTSPMVNIARDGKLKDKTAVEKHNKMMSENSKKSMMIDRSQMTPTTTNGLTMKNSDEMNAAQSLLKVGQDIRLSKPPMIADLHGKYNCESSLQITKVTEPETNQSSTALEKQPNSQPSLQIMRVPPAADNATKPAAVTKTVSNDSTNGNSSNAVVNVTNKPVNKKPVPSLYSMPTKSRTKEADHNHNNTTANTDSKCVERRVDTENGVLSVSLLTETTKQDMDAKRREIVQPDVSIKLMSFAGTATTEPAKKTPELNPINSSVKRHQDDMSQAEGAVSGNKKKRQDESERKTSPPRSTSTKDDVPQLIEINSSPYGKLLPSKNPQFTSKPSSIPKQLVAPKPPQLSPKQQVHVQKSQLSPKQLQSKHQSGATPAGANILDLSKSPPNGTVKRHSTTDVTAVSAGFSPNKKKTTASPVQYAPSTIAAATSAAINSNLLFAAQRQAAAFLLKQHFDTLNNGMIRNGGKGPTDWPQTIFNPAMFARPPPTNLNN